MVSPPEVERDVGGHGKEAQPIGRTSDATKCVRTRFYASLSMDCIGVNATGTGYPRGAANVPKCGGRESGGKRGCLGCGEAIPGTFARLTLAASEH